jgi:hypothetical protein
LINEDRDKKETLKWFAFGMAIRERRTHCATIISPDPQPLKPVKFLGLLKKFS